MKLERSKDFNVNLSINDYHRFSGGHVNNPLTNKGYLFPSRPAKKLKWDVENEITINNLIDGLPQYKQKVLNERKEALNKLKIKGTDGLESKIQGGVIGDTYWTNRKIKSAEDKFLSDLKVARSSLFDQMPRDYSSDSVRRRRDYQQLVEELAKLPRDKREAAYDAYKKNTYRSLRKHDAKVAINAAKKAAGIEFAESTDDTEKQNKVVDKLKTAAAITGVAAALATPIVTAYKVSDIIASDMSSEDSFDALLRD